MDIDPETGDFSEGSLVMVRVWTGDGVKIRVNVIVCCATVGAGNPVDFVS